MNEEQAAVYEWARYRVPNSAEFAITYSHLAGKDGELSEKANWWTLDHIQSELDLLKNRRDAIDRQITQYERDIAKRIKAMESS